MAKPRIIMLTNNGWSTFAIYNHLSQFYDIEKVIIENKENKWFFYKRRAQKIGWPKVLGQLAFLSLVVPTISILSKSRIKEIVQLFNLNISPIPESKIIHVPSINSSESLAAIKENKPNIAIVNGTRILSKKVLTEIHATFINTHMGITPKYRGVHGGYWALVSNDIENAGTTVHLVDKGIDTGGIIYQSYFKNYINSRDSFITYPYLQIGTTLGFIKKAIEDIENNKISIQTAQSNESKLWYQPTFFDYFYNRFMNNVK